MSDERRPIPRQDSGLSFDFRRRSPMALRGVRRLAALFNERPSILWCFRGYGEKLPAQSILRPSTLSVLHQNIPQELIDRHQWVCWDWAWRYGTWRKPPISPTTGGLASELDPLTWSSVDEAIKFSARHGLPGIGFVLTANDPYIGVDLDDCRNTHTGELDDWAARIVALLGSYTEISPSGSGIHVIVRGEVSDDGFRRPQPGAPEIYDRTQYLAFTGQIHPGSTNHILDRHVDVTDLLTTLSEVETSPIGPASVWPSLTSLSTSKNTVLAETWNHNLCGLDTSSGHPRWSFERSVAQNYSSPIASSNTFVLEDSCSMCALDALTGEELWRCATEGGSITATVHNGLAFVRSCIYGNDVKDDTLSALHVITGEVLWRIQLQGGFSAPKPFSDFLWIEDFEGVAMLDIATGKELLRRETDPATSVLIGPDAILLQREEVLSAIDPVNGQDIWRYIAGYEEWLQSASSVVVMCTSYGDHGEIARRFLIDAKTGLRRWTLDGDRSLRLGVSSSNLAFIDGSAITALDALSGTEVWHLPAEESKARIFAEVNGSLFAMDGSSLISIDAINGRVRWRLPMDKVPADSPTDNFQSLNEVNVESVRYVNVDGSMIYVVADHTLVAISDYGTQT